MKKLVSVILAMALLLSCTVLFTACDSSSGSSSKSDKAKGNRYNLVDIEFANITVDAYEYNYIEFDFEEGTYRLQNKVKANGVITKQSGEFTVDEDGYLTITNDDVPTQDYFLYDGEDLYFADSKQTTLRVEAYIPGYGDVYMEFKK